MFLSTEYSSWLILLCLLAAAAASLFLYYKSNPDIEGRYAKWIKRGLFLFRFLSIFIISFLLLGPLLRLVLRKTEKPYVILALDNSQSLVALKDSAFYRTQLPGIIRTVQDELDGDYEVKPYLFGKEIKAGSGFTFSEKQTDISRVFDEIDNVYSGQNIGAVVLATDGIFNEGSNPSYSIRGLKAPVYTLALGDSNQHKDLLIPHVRYNQLSYLGNMFPLQVDVKAFGCNGSNVTATVSHNGQVLATKAFSVNNGSFFTSVPFELEAKHEGTQHYVVSVSRLQGEVTYANNQFDVFIQVISGRQKIRIVYNSPHPDIAALKQSLEQNENYEAAIAKHDEVKLSNDESLVILHQLPGPRGEGANLIKQLTQKRVPLLYVLGSQTNTSLLNSIEPAISITNARGGTNDALPVYDPSFASFNIGTDELENIKKFPPLLAPYGNYKMNGEADVLFRQQIGYVKTDFPLIFFSRREGYRKGFICGEGIWKWRMYDFNISRQQTINNLVSKIVQYLATKEDKGRFRVTGKKRFAENEHILFDAEVYNESYELINTPEVSITVRNAQGKQYPYTFSRTARSYTLDAGLLPAGNYTYESKVTIGAKTEMVKGQFTIAPLMVEFTQTVADHQLLNELAQQSGGKMFYPQQAAQLIDAIRSNENIRPVIYKQEEMKSWINLKWLFFVLLVMMSVEWFVRKWNGTV